MERDLRKREKELAKKKKSKQSVLGVLAEAEDENDLTDMIKPRKKKLLVPKKLVTDEHGEEWQVIDKKKRVFVEVEDEEEK